MHGFIFIEFEKFALTQVSYKTWFQIMADNQLQDRIYSPVNLYPDSEMMSLLHSTSVITQIPPEELLEKFGFAIVPDLLKVYRAYIDPSWKTLDMLQHAETTIHQAVRKSTAGAAPPILDIRRISPNELEIHYISSRNMVELGVGIVKGIANAFGELNEIKVDLQKFEDTGKSLISVRKYF